MLYNGSCWSDLWRSLYLCDTFTNLKGVIEMVLNGDFDEIDEDDLDDDDADGIDDWDDDEENEGEW